MNADHVGRGCTESALGQEWHFVRETREIDDAFSRHARTVLPDPVEAVCRNLEKIALKDAEILRGIQIKDGERNQKRRSRQPPGNPDGAAIQAFRRRDDNSSRKQGGLLFGVW